MPTWQKENNHDIILKLVLFLISPFFAFVYSLRTMRTRSSYVVYFLFAIFFGMAFTVPSGKTEGYGMDGASYRAWFEYDTMMHSSEFKASWEEYLEFDEGKKDFYFDGVSFVVSRLTDNYHYLFMVLAVVFAFFMLRSFRFLTAENNLNFSIAGIILAYLFTYNQIFNINGMRFWTAAWIGVYVIFKIFKKGDKRYWLLALITPFFHGSFWVFIGVLLIAQFTKRFQKTWTILFVISFFVSNIAIEVIQYTYAYLPAFLSRMVDSYTDPIYMQSRNEMGIGYSWVPYTFGILERVFRSLLIFLFVFNSKQITANPKTKNLYLFLLVWATIFNFFTFIPSLGGRFITFVWPMVAYIWLVHFKDRKYQIVLYATPFILIWNMYELFNYYMLVLSLDFFISNPFLLIYKYLIVG